MSKPFSDPVERFWRSFEPEPNSGCWLWTAYKYTPGYGRMYVNGTCTGAHRYSYELFRGPIPPGLDLDHLCRTPACVNPQHLEPVTHKVNIRRGKRGSITHCRRGHAFTGLNTYIKPTGQRACRTCGAARSHAAFRRRKPNARTNSPYRTKRRLAEAQCLGI